MAEGSADGLAARSHCQKRWQRFKQSRRGYISAWLLLILTTLSLAAEFIANNRALLVVYDGQLYFPTLAAQYNGRDFGLEYDYEVNYRELKQHFAAQPQGNWLVMPPVRFGPLENDLIAGDFPPHAPPLPRAIIWALTPADAMCWRG